MGAAENTQTQHATCIAVQEKAALILGPSGSGKSSLALQLIALGARLVSDDRTLLRLEDDVLLAQAPSSISGLIEARGVGLIRLDPVGPVPVSLIVDLARSEDKRLPHPHSREMLGITLPCLFNAPSPHFAAAILLSLTGSISPAQ